jgi:hypothetical protein
VAYNFPTANNKIRLITEYEIVTQKVTALPNKMFLVTLSYSISGFIFFPPV